MRRFSILAALTLMSSAACADPILVIGNKGEDSVSFVSLETGKELGRTKTGKAPHEIAVSPDGRQAAVVAYGGKSIDIFDVATRAKVKTIDLTPNEGPHGIVWQDGGQIVVTTERSRTLTIVDPDTGTVAAAIATGQAGSHMVAVSSDGSTAFTANIPAGTVSVIDLGTGRKSRDILVGGEPEGIALSKDGRTLWVGDLSAPRVQIFDTATFARLGEVATGKVPIRVAASPVGKWIVTSNLGSGSLTVIDVASRKAAREIEVSGSQQAGQVTILFSADGKRVYAAETGRDTVAEIELASGKVLRRLPAGRQGDGLAIAGE